MNSKTKLRASIPGMCKSEKVSTETINDDHEKVDIFGKHFSSVFIKEPDWNWLLSNDKKATVNEELTIEITEELILKKLNDLNTNKSPGPDSIHPKVFKELRSVLVKPLFIIYNTSF